MTDPIRWGIVGPGGIANAFAEDLAIAGCRVQAVASRSADRAREFASRHGVAEAHGGYDEIFANPRVDVVYIATPHPTHVPLALEALRGGKHVLVEKPISIDAEGARALTVEAARRGLFLAEGVWTSFLPHIRAVKELAAEGCIGAVRGVIAHHCQSLTTDPGHRVNALELGGGALLDLGVYPASFLVDLLGPRLRTAALATFNDSGSDAQVALSCVSPDGATGVSMISSRTDGPTIASIQGEAGRIDLDADWYKPTDFRLIAEGRTTEFRSDHSCGLGLHHEAREVERCIAAGLTESPLRTHADSLSTMRLLDRIRADIGLRYPV